MADAARTQIDHFMRSGWAQVNKPVSAVNVVDFSLGMTGLDIDPIS